MIVKQRDARLTTIRALEARSSSTTDKVKRAACISAAARLRADSTTQNATDLIDIQFGQSDEWAVIHDLRLRVGGHAVQINHLLINSSLNFFCLDSRFVDYGLEFGNRGQCHAINRVESRVVASPTRKMGKDLRMLRSYLSDTGLLPRRFGLTPKPAIKGYVLTNPGLRLNYDNHTASNDIGVHPSDALFALLWKRDMSVGRLLNKKVSVDELRELALRLIESHLPVFSQELLHKDTLVNRQTYALLSAAR